MNLYSDVEILQNTLNNLKEDKDRDRLFIINYFIYLFMLFIIIYLYLIFLL